MAAGSFIIFVISPARPHAINNSASIGWILSKFCIRGFNKIRGEYSGLFKMRQNMTLYVKM
jgi:hypothetical protein